MFSISFRRFMRALGLCLCFGGFGHWESRDFNNSFENIREGFLGRRGISLEELGTDAYLGEGFRETGLEDCFMKILF